MKQDPKKTSSSSLAFIEFVKAGLRDPLQVSTIIQTTPFTARRLAQSLSHKSTPFVVELGVGAGAVTESIRHHLVNSGQYFGMEINPRLAEFMKLRYPHLQIINDSAENLYKHLQGRKADLIVSTLPWTLLGPRVMERILGQVHEALKDDGEFATYVAANALMAKSAKHFFSQLDSRFGSHTEEWEFLNIPPAKIIRVKK